MKFNVSNLKFERKQAGLTQAALAEGICSVGLISRIENGNSDGSGKPGLIEALAKRLGVTAEALQQKESAPTNIAGQLEVEGSAPNATPENEKHPLDVDASAGAGRLTVVDATEQPDQSVKKTLTENVPQDATIRKRDGVSMPERKILATWLDNSTFRISKKVIEMYSADELRQILLLIEQRSRMKPVPRPGDTVEISGMHVFAGRTVERDRISRIVDRGDPQAAEPEITTIGFVEVPVRCDAAG
ncbi:helix-turn-helix domain-containing protein [Tumebacillus permanentifrigoris]|uniref:Transcriptional regulator with XRE-family HTH domain n=1 Tax=Tumebacillus permanentifrigoris TaxID=378543 RepID=A0A316D7B7_9BACL|nr:helix-turn-helix transcriptional regulator [Tumebacillus permanentifrigoris]PWK05279.1 transcriptional regulator with XRE-family HTH domain [Tumebacillus permanentifrigoris]